MRCDKCGWYRPEHAVCEFDYTLTEPYESCLNWKPITNADRLNAMTVEEKAEWLSHLFPMLAYEWLLDWLKQEVMDEG